MMSRVSGLAHASTEGSRAEGAREETSAAAKSGARRIQRTLGNRIAGMLAELSQTEAVGGAAAQEAARRGLSGAGQALPHLSTIQRSFGRHDVRGVSAHSGAAAQEAAQELGAAAYTSGEQVAFAAAPDLRTAAHEAAHVIQQRSGVELPGGIDRPGDRFERHADAVAEHVVAGRSAEPLLDAFAGPRAAGPSTPAVQRRLTVTAADLVSTRSWLGKRQDKQDLLAEVAALLRAYEGTQDPGEEMKLLRALGKLLRRWERPKRMPRSSRLRRRYELLGQIEAEAAREYEMRRFEKKYMRDDPPFAYLDDQAPHFAFNPARKLKKGEVGPDQANAGKASIAVVQDNDLSAAEVAAIRVFSLSDYQYINPAVADDRAWLTRNFPGESDQEQDERMAEGRLHAAMMLEGLAKLPPWRGTAYRGERMTPKLYYARYVEKSMVKLPSFASMTTKSDVADLFAAGGGNTAADATVSVKVTLDVTYARDIGKLSAVRSENEVLLLPGAEFAIERTRRLAKGDPGAPPATAWYEVHLRQIR